MNRCLSLLILIFGFFFFEANSQSQQNFTIYKETEGNYIYSILADRQGQIWIGYSKGLIRYNGYEFKKFEYNPNDSSSIKSSYITRLFEDHKGRIWIGGESKLYNYRPLTKKIKKFDYHSLIPSTGNHLNLTVGAIVKDYNNNLLFGVASDEDIVQSLLILDEGNDKLRLFPIPDSLKTSGMVDVVPDQKGNILFVDFNLNLFYKERSSVNLSRISPYTELQVMIKQSSSGYLVFDQHDQLWMANSDGHVSIFNQLDQAPVKVYSFRHLFVEKEKMYVSCLAFDRDQNVWLGTNQGLIFFNRKTEEFQRFELPQNEKSIKNEVSALCFDSFNNLWIGTQYGLLKYENKPVFTSYRGKGLDTSNTINGYVDRIRQAWDGNLLIPNFGGDQGSPLMNELNLKTNTISRYSLENFFPKNIRIYDYSETGRDTFIFGTNQGLYSFDRKNKKSKKIFLDGIPNVHPGIGELYTDKFGNVWLGSLNYLYRKLKDQSTFSAIDLSKIPGGSEKSNNVFPADGKSLGVWLLTEDGLFLYDYSTKVITKQGWDKKEGDAFIAKNMYGIYHDDSSGVAWIGIYQGGLNRYDLKTKKIKTYTVEDGLADMSVFGIVPDDANQALWLSTLGGISRFDIQTEKFTNFSSEDGIDGNGFNFGLKSSDGQIFFAGDGLLRFDPKSITQFSTPPLVSFVDFKVSNRSIVDQLDSLSDHAVIHLKHNQNNVTIDYLGVHYSNPGKNKYAYKLEPYDDQWIQVGNQHSAYYTNLPSGKYTFKVKAANGNGIWNEEGASLNITILPPWWNTTWAYAGYILLVIILGSVVNQSYRQYVLKKERERSQLKELQQAKEIEKAYKELEVSHQTLQSTQSQLIQSEKMASLGELTAGIAHEIQNPLNFVNNFSSVNSELIDEMKVEIEQGNTAMALTLANDIAKNESKIVQHGKRAENIVKAMLQHSRKSAGTKEPTDINTLVEEFMRLSYHGLRAKEKSFNAELILDLDPNLPLVPVIPQDLGRVILNLFNNAFYAVTATANRSLEKNETEKNSGQIIKNHFAPEVKASTRYIKNSIKGDVVEIRIKDNGSGIPKLIRDKIFQPFFTTKPSGEGTGLGLSLTYDIIHAHGGSIRLETKHYLDDDTNGGSGSEFIIELPV